VIFYYGKKWSHILSSMIFYRICIRIDIACSCLSIHYIYLLCLFNFLSFFCGSSVIPFLMPQFLPVAPLFFVQRVDSFSLLFLQLDREKESRGECEVVRVDRTEIHGGSRRGDDLPRNRSTCSWHQKPMLTTSNNSSKPSALSLSLSLSRLSKS